MKTNLNSNHAALNYSHKKSSCWSIILFALFKIWKSMSILLLTGLALVLMGGLTLYLILATNDLNKLIINFQYGVLILTNLLVLLFILFIAIKIFAREFQDGTYLLLISKPYHKSMLFLLKLIALWISILLFLIIGLGIPLIINLIFTALSFNPANCNLLTTMLIKLIIYLLFFSFLAASGILFAISFLHFQVVLLIVIIFCSLFLIGGIPYTLIFAMSDNISLKYGDNKYHVSDIKTTLLFPQMLKNNLISYPHLTTALYDFYAKKTINQLTQILVNQDDESLRLNRLMFINHQLGLTAEKHLKLTAHNVSAWKGTYNGTDINSIINTDLGAGTTTTITLNISSQYFFKSYDDLNDHNIYQHELKTLVDNYQKIVDWNTFYNLKLSTTSSLYVFDPNNNWLTVDQNSYHEQNYDPVDIFQNLFLANFVGQKSNYVANDSQFSLAIMKLFENNVFYVFKELEDNIIKKVLDYKIITTQFLTVDSNWQHYVKLMHLYRELSIINVLEHWNQLWTMFLPVNKYWFVPLSNSVIDFTNQRNYLMSYQDFPLELGNGKITSNYQFFLNAKPIIISYLTFSVVLLFLSYFIIIIIIKRNIL
ncbi:ABC transporter permease [Spiroplasma eriocheiris]|nr:ABC transporter permease [Spiroplasma eriocheiris]AHF58022.1 putative transmembrane protein [Spiroplasma eriocheiris CCTCC M 207170]